MTQREMAMVRHIVMWKLRDKTDAAPLKQRLEALNGRIPGLIRLEAGVDFLASEQSCDLVLVADLENRAALDTYQAHAAHQAVVPLVRSAAVSRAVVDYEI
jgi:Stress responsive A/B Barrel Domain